MYDCDKYEHCSAPICPLWNSIKNQTMGKGERVCFYLLEYQKNNSEVIFKESGRSAIYKVMGKATNDINEQPERHPQLSLAIKKASKTGSRILAGKKLNA